MALNISKRYKIWFSVSAVIIIIGVIMMITSGLNLGIDFTGGTMMQVEFGKTVPASEIRETLAAFELSPEVVHVGDDKTEAMIKTKKALDNAERQEVFAALQEKYTLSDDALRGASQFGPAMGEEIRNRALMAILIASVCMLVYITVRFEMVFGIAAIVCLIHDVLILLSVYAIFRIVVNSSFIAAILTIVGYSINDTIVVFDRIRENVKRARGKQFFETADQSIRQTISRTINTSLTTLVVVGSLYIFGVVSIKELALPLFVGIAVGTYSSIFIASPVWAIIHDKLSGKHQYQSK